MDQQSSFNIFTFFLTTEAEPASETSGFVSLQIMAAPETTSVPECPWNVADHIKVRGEELHGSTQFIDSTSWYKLGKDFLFPRNIAQGTSELEQSMATLFRNATAFNPLQREVDTVSTVVAN